MKKINWLKETIKNNKKVLYSFILGLLISTGLVYVYADTYLYDSSNILYTPSHNLTSTNVQAAIDELKLKCTRYDVNVTVNNGTVTGSSTKNIRTGKTTTFTVNPNSNYGNGTVSCTNGQTATLSGSTVTTGAITNNTTCTVTYTPLSRTVTVNVTNGTPATQNKTINYNTSTTFTVTPNTNYGGGQVSCTNSQTATLSGTTLTTGNITSNTTCTVTFELGPACSGASGTTNGYCAYGKSCKTGYSSYCSGGYQQECTGGYTTVYDDPDCLARQQAWHAKCDNCQTSCSSSGTCCPDSCRTSTDECTSTQVCNGGYSSVCQGWSPYSYNYCG